ncbi:putative ADP-ribosylglycohydrolase [Lachnospiraceae bacterium KM106-2]|nr:putative ADP-ribosylglycohydrolase [Lachnospiraceae bacterium KM106-2]
MRSPLLEENKLRAVRSTSPLFTEVLGGIKNQDYGTKESPINDRKEDDVLAFGPPVGLYFMDSPSMAFRVASEIAAMIYGNPTAYLSVGLFAAIISLVASGSSILEAVPHALSILGGYHGSREVYDTVILALEKGKKKNTLEYADHHSTAATTLARGIYDVLLYEENYEEAIILAIQGKRKNQIGYICGCLLGLKLGLDEIPKDAVESIDCIDIILKMSDKLGISYENKLYIT